MKIVTSVILHYEDYEPIVEVDEMLSLAYDESILDSIEIDADEIDQFITDEDKYQYDYQLLLLITISEEYSTSNSINGSDSFNGLEIDYYVRDIQLIDSTRYFYD